MKEANSVTI